MPANLSSIRIWVPLIPPSFKNHKRAGINRKTGKMMTYTRADIKKRMNQLEDAILSALWSSCQTAGGEMDLECRKRLLTHLSGLCDDSVKEIPRFLFDAQQYAKEGEQAGIWIEIERLPITHND